MEKNTGKTGKNGKRYGRTQGGGEGNERANWEFGIGFENNKKEWRVLDERVKLVEDNDQEKNLNNDQFVIKKQKM